MGITNRQDVPEKVVAKEPWSIKRLFSNNRGVAMLAKVTTNPFDMFLCYLVGIIGAVELFGRHISWMFWVFTVLILLMSIVERHANVLFNAPQEAKKK